jgi:hypothetical protein
LATADPASLFNVQRPARLPEHDWQAQRRATRSVETLDLGSTLDHLLCLARWSHNQPACAIMTPVTPARAPATPGVGDGINSKASGTSTVAH